MRSIAHPVDDRATGVFGSAFGFTVFLVFLLFAVQLLFGLYTRTAVTAVATDIAQEAANEGEPAASPARTAYWEQEARRRLGGDAADFTVSAIDTDADGRADTVAVSVTTDLPRLLPVRWVPGSPSTYQRTVRSRIETFAEPT